MCEAARHARLSSEACEARQHSCKAEIPTPNKKANHKLSKLTVG